MSPIAVIGKEPPLAVWICKLLPRFQNNGSYGWTRLNPNTKLWVRMTYLYLTYQQQKMQIGSSVAFVESFRELKHWKVMEDMRTAEA